LKIGIAFDEQWNRRNFTHNRNSDGNLYVRYLYWNGDRWDWNNSWLDNGWNDNNPAALRATFFISHPRRETRVCFVLLESKLKMRKPTAGAWVFSLL